MDFVQSNIDKCVFYKYGSILLLYVNDVLVFGKDEEATLAIYNTIKENRFTITNKGDVTDNPSQCMSIQEYH